MRYLGLASLVWRAPSRFESAGAQPEPTEFEAKQFLRQLKTHHSPDTL